MVLAQGKKGIKSRSIERHHLFGWRFLDHHQFKTEKWALSTYAGQYKTMIDILAKNGEYSVLKARDERSKQKKILAQIAAECKMGRIKLQEGLLGNPQQIRNLLYNHREMQRLYQKMPSYMIVEDIDQKTFVLRKERDCLRCDRNKLLRLYEKKKKMVRVPDKAKPCLPRALRRHVLFGWKFYEKHQFWSDKWALTLLTQQFRCMIDLLLKHIEYKNLSKKATIGKQKRLLVQLQKQCKDGRSKLKEGLYGNCQKIKNLLHHNREMQRLYQNMPSSLVVENIDQRTFIERKERDKLQYRRDQLLKQYEEKMIEISELEDKATYADIYIIPEENLVKKYRKELTDAQTRLKAAKNILLAYRKIIDTLHEDAIYYEPVLDSLQLDLEEQSNFISQVINMGLPAMSNLKILTEQYNKLEEETRKAMQSKMELLAVFRKRGGEQVKEIAQMFKAADERNSQLRVYRRETPSMTNLKEHMEKIEKNILEVKNAVLAPGATSIFPLMKKQAKKNAILKKELDFRDREFETLENIDTQAKLMNDLLKYNLTDEEIERKNTIKTLKSDIETQKQLKDQYEQEMHEKGDIFAYLRFSMQHLLDVLNNVGDPLPVPIRRYPAQDLKLPLLRFDARMQEHYPPDPFEENAEKLLVLAKKRVGEVMQPFKDVAANAIEASRAKYHADFAEAFAVEAQPAVAGEEANPFEDSLIGEKDQGVPSRKQIKVISAQIVEANMKKDDQ